jgi:hypothetical protein
VYRYVLDQEPYGKDLVVALVAAQDLPGSVLPKEEAGEFYVTQLQAAIREWREHGVKVSADVMVLETLAPGMH